VGPTACLDVLAKANFTLDQAMKVQWGSRGIALLFFNLNVK